MLVATAISTGRKPVTKLAVKSISPATTLSPSRAPRCRRRLKTASTVPVAASAPLNSTSPRSSVTALSTLSPVPLPGGRDSSCRMLSMVSAERTEPIASNRLTTSRAQPIAAITPPTVAWRGRAGAFPDPESLTPHHPWGHSITRAGTASRPRRRARAARSGDRLPCPPRGRGPPAARPRLSPRHSVGGVRPPDAQAPPRNGPTTCPTTGAPTRRPPGPVRPVAKRPGPGTWSWWVPVRPARPPRWAR